jgi:iron(III) transport system substrate-binding protein
MTFDRRGFLAATAAATLTPRLLRAQEPEIAALYDAAREEGELTWYVAHFSSEVCERMGREFTALYPGVNVNVVRTTAQVAYQRLNQDLQAGVNNCDVFASTVIAHCIELKSRDLLMQYEPVRLGNVFDAFRGVDPENYFHITAGSPVNIVYNTDLVSEADAPRTWQQMIEERWTDQIATGHPGFSGFVGNWVVLMRDKYGWEYFETLAERNPYIGRSIIDVTTTCAAGERSVGAGPGQTTLISAANGNPVANIYPEDGTVVISSPSAIMADARHPNAAKLFMEFLLGPDNAAIMVDEWGAPIVEGPEPRPGVARFAEIPTIAATADQLINGIPEVRETWRDTFGI